MGRLTRLTLCVPYAIRGASRPRAGTRKVRGKDGSAKAVARVYTEDKHRDAEADLMTLLASAAREQGWAHVSRPGIVAVTIDLYTARNKAEMKPAWPDDPFLCAGKPDVDNAAKLAMDAGTKVGKPPKPKRRKGSPKAVVQKAAVAAGLWDDDSQVAALLVRRWRSAKGGSPMTMVVVETLPGPVVTKRHRRTE